MKTELRGINPFKPRTYAPEQVIDFDTKRKQAMNDLGKRALDPLRISMGLEPHFPQEAAHKGRRFKLLKRS